MKKLLTLFLIVIMSFSFKQSNAQAYKEGNMSFSAGYGFVTLLGSLKSTYDAYGDTKFSQTGPIYLKGERALSDHIGLGLNLAYVKNSFAYSYASEDLNGNPTTYTETDSRTSISVLARLNYHFGNMEKFDPYVGIGLGYRSGGWKFTTNDPNGDASFSFPNIVPLGFELTIGARYLITDNFGVYAEVGGAKSIFQIGVNVNLPNK